MKKLLKNYLIIATVLTGLFGHGAEKKAFDNDLKAKESYVTFSDVKKGSVLLLKNINDQIIYKEEILESGNYSRKFDFALLPEGIYFFELIKEIEINTKSIKVDSNSVIFFDEIVSKFFKPSVTLKGSKILISQLSLNKQPLKIKLFYENGIGGYDLIYTDTLSGKVVLNTVLKLSKKRSGMYKVVLFSENQMFEETLNLL